MIVQMPDIYKIPRRDDYTNALIDLNSAYPDDVTFHKKTIEIAKNLSPKLLTTLGIIGCRAMPQEQDRAERLELCRAILLGAAAGTLVATTVHDLNDPFGDYTSFDAAPNQLPPHEFISELHEGMDELQGITGKVTRSWLESRASQAAEIGMIHRDLQAWYPIGAAQTIGLLYTRVVTDAGRA
jgi:hypothetical protein